MASFNWADVTSENVISAIKRFKLETPDYPEPRSYYLVYNGDKLPAKHIRGMAYEDAFGENIGKDEYNGGMQTQKFFEKLGFVVERYDSNENQPQKFDSWTILSDTLAVKKCDKSFFDYRVAGIPAGIRWFFDAENMNKGQKKIITIIYEGKAYSAEIAKSNSTESTAIRLFWRSSGIGELFDEYKPDDGGEYPEAEFEKLDSTTYSVILSVPGGSKNLSVNDAVWVAAAVMSYEKYHKDGSRILPDFTFQQKTIVDRAQEYTKGTVDANRVSWRVCGDQAKHTKSYLRAIESSGANKRRLSFPDEFNDGKSEPTGLDMSLTISSSLGDITLQQLYDFVHTEYAAMKDQVIKKVDIDYIGVLDYLNANQEIPYSNPDAAGIDPEEKERLISVKEKGQKAVGEIKKMADACDKAYKLDKCLPISWLDGSNTKTRKYLWAQMKYKNYSDDPSSISIFVEKNGNSGARYRISLELNNDGTDKKTVARYHSYLEMPIDFDTGLVLASGSNEWGHPEVLNESQESVKNKVASGAYRKVQLCKYIERKPDETNAYFHKELMKAVGLLIPYYEHVLGIKDEEWWPSKEEYDPGLTVEQWIDILNDKEITTDNNLRMFAEWLDYGKPAACSEIADYYGETKNFFNAGSSSLARRIVDKGKCQAPPDRDNENARWWPVIYVGRDAEKHEKGSYIWKLRDEVKQALEQVELPDVKENIKMNTDKKFGLNTILYGPPGTGKTYNTVRIAVSICEPELNVDEMEYSDVLEKYRELKKDGRIEFTTFHQSYGYEEFIEGIKPIMVSESGKTNSKDVQYDVMPGVFKIFCENAKKVTISDEGSDVEKTNPKVWCLLLDGTGESKLKTYCFENDEIRIGWSKLPERITYETPIDTDATRNMLTNFQDDMEIGDIVVIQKAFDRIDAIGIITGDYEFDTAPLNGDWPRKRSVKWMAKEIDEDLYELNGNKHLGRYTIYPLGRIKADDLIKIANKNHQGEEIVVEQETKPYVFIIDEINRGNISKIFGELITLIETTKRAGADEAMETTLPYSGDPFSVPNNVYILGTMNTADRSIALMDTALRRRFDFEEMMPDPRVIEGITVSADGETLDVAQMLKTINRRIEYLYDREHTIGHAFFTKLKYNNSMECLAEIFKDNVVPLLQEYFYEDYEKIQLVLGDNDKSSDSYKFILDKKVNENEIFKKSPQLDLHEKTYEIQKGAFDKIRSYIEITETRKAEE